jgi:uncharacterized membrane protein YqjE
MGQPQPNGQQALREQSTGDLIRQLSEQTSDLVRQEVALAKAELTQKGKQAGIGAGMFGGASLMTVLGLIALTAAAIAGLSEAMDVWAAALIVGAVYLAAAGVLALLGRNRIQEGMPAKPEQTIETVKEDMEWAKSQAKSVRR